MRPEEQQCGVGCSPPGLKEGKKLSKRFDIEVKVTILEKKLKPEERVMPKTLIRQAWLTTGPGGYLGKEATTCFPE